MHRLAVVTSVVLALAGLVGSRFAAAAPPDEPAPPLVRRIDPAAAIKLAEEFVRTNGYTDFVPPDASKLVPETLEMAGRADWLASRQGTLRPRAVGYLTHGKNGAGWTIGFEYTNQPAGAATGRAVTMDEAGKKVIVQHKDLLLKPLEPRPADPKPEPEPEPE